MGREMTPLLCAIVLIVLPIHLDRYMAFEADVAHVVERMTCNHQGAGSTPAIGSTLQSAPVAQFVGQVDSMVATYQKCLLIAPKLRPEIVMAAFRYGVKYRINPDLLLAIAFVESSFNPAKSNRGCIGLMQINYRVWRKELSLNLYKLWEIDYNMDKGALILRRYINKSGDLWQGVHLYNNGYRGQNMAYVPKVKAMYKKIMEASCQL